MNASALELLGQDSKRRNLGTYERQVEATRREAHQSCQRNGRLAS